MEIGLNFEITKEWFDVRLTYWNVKIRRYDNSLSIEDKYDYGRLICFIGYELGYGHRTWRYDLGYGNMIDLMDIEA